MWRHTTEPHCKKSNKNFSKALTTYESNSRRRKSKIKQTNLTQLCRNEAKKKNISAILRM